MLNNYIVMDLENPNLRGNSICQIAVVTVSNGEITDKIATYINPEDRFDSQNIKIHGISREMTANAPVLPEFWADMHSLFEENVIIGHNIRYDLSVLAKSLNRYNLEVPIFQYIDTLDLSREYMNAGSYKLESLSKQIGYTYTSHDALEDSLACYNLFAHLTSYCNAVPKVKRYADPLKLSSHLDERLVSSLNELSGIVHGIASDGVVNEAEVRLLQKWYEDNCVNKQYAVFNTILTKLDEILEDGIVTEYERRELLTVVESINSSSLYNEATLAIQVLEGFIKGIISDDQIEKEEIESLRLWLLQHDYLAGIFPYDKILLEVNQVLEDGILTEDEKESLFKMFDEILNPIKDTAFETDLSGKTFCLTGDFTGFSKAEIAQKLVDQGAIERKSVSSKLDYLFVGAEGSQAWKYGSYGGKVAKAMEIQENGGKVKIIAQADMDVFLNREPIAAEFQTESAEKLSLEAERETGSAEKPALTLQCDADNVLNFAAVHNGVHIIRDIIVTNHSKEELKDLTVRISSDGDFLENKEFGINQIRAEEEIHLTNHELKFDVNALVSLTERITCGMIVEIYSDEMLLVSETTNISVLAFDEWPGLQYTPELLTAFSMPNHPVVVSLMQLAAQYLEKWTGDPSLAGYQYDEPARVKSMAAAAYAAIQQKNITYAEPPSSFEKFGQRIRLADTVLEQHLGTCMDLTLLYAASLEAMGLNPLLVMMKGHIFAGVWHIDESFPNMITDDPSQLEKRMSRGIHELTVVECTALCAGKHMSFDDAVAAAEKNVADYANFAFVIDVKRARSMGIRPLPVRIRTATGFEVRHEDRKEKDVTGASKGAIEIFDMPDSMHKDQVTKITQWERKLLDLSLRNMLINLRLTKAVIPVLSADVGLLEDALSDGEEFQVLARPQEMVIEGGGITVEALGHPGPLAEFIKLESSHKRLHSIYTKKELASALTRLYRSAKTSMEENGASTLYLVLGVLRWYENKKNSAPRYAPVVLLPIDIIRKSAGKGYTMRMRDEDAQINITLCEFLKQNFDIHVQGLNPPPEDDHGLDIPRVFALMRHAVMSMPGWDVVEVGLIGNFSFSQFVMWNDIHSNTAFLENHKIVRSLINSSIEWDCHLPEGVDTDEAYLPITVDSSQLRAINMAAAGVSFVLYGPPGTGKSQTITAMIANALTKGKTVLFVAEKMAALEVVQKRLEALGIQDFCLELHSNKATKKAALDQLSRGLEIGVWGISTDYDEKINDVRRIRAELDAYAKALHSSRSFGKSLRELIDLYELIPETGKSLRFDRSFAASLTERELDHYVYSLERLLAAGRGIGHPHDHPLQAVHTTQYRQRIKFDLDIVIGFYIDSLKALRDIGYAAADLLHIDRPVTKSAWKELRNCARAMIAAEGIPAFLRNCSDVDREFAVAEEYISKLQLFSVRESEIRKNWSDSFLRMDMNTYRARYDEAGKKLFGKAKSYAALASEMQAFAAFSLEAERIPVYLTEITAYQQEAAEMKAIRDALPYEWRTLLEQYQTPEELQEYKNTIKSRLQAVSEFTVQAETFQNTGALKTCTEKAKELEQGFESVEKAEAEVQTLLQPVFEGGNADWIEDRIRTCSDILEHASSLKDWIVYQQHAAECREMGLGVVCDAYEAGVSNDEIMNVFLRSIYRVIILTVIENEPVLNGFTGIGFNEKIAQFKKLDQEFMDLTREEMYYKLTHNLPTDYESVEISKELNILRRAIKSNGRGLSIRSLFEQIPHILTRLCPCMLMSPISAAQYLEPKNDMFDIVIFDEASQMPTCKAVGVLARGKNAVIAGDPNQMPPTSFFAGSAVDEDNLDIEDLDSILDDCLALGMPSSYLHWHYRSRHESLIAFSNQEFYENSMLTFPSVNDRETRLSLVKTDGYFERGKRRVNEGEAKKIVEEIKHRYKSPESKGQTIGVVTFNINQQTLIEDLLQAEYEKDPAFDNWANMGGEPLFVKNLENVQGDERDVILFSVTYGPDAEGKLLMNFGPLNKEGGWKRLNVAVSRARSEMVVFSCMTADMIDLKRTKAKGIEALKNFLEYAGKGRLKGEYQETETGRAEGILMHICECLTSGGYKYQRSVGHSRFKVDIAVINPYNEEEFLLGIMLDGDSYQQSKNTKDRELSQINVLNGLGWELHRIWTMDWWDNREKELEKLMSLLEEKERAAKAASEEKAAVISEATADTPAKSEKTEYVSDISGTTEDVSAVNAQTVNEQKIPAEKDNPQKTESAESATVSKAEPQPDEKESAYPDPAAKAASIKSSVKQDTHRISADGAANDQSYRIEEYVCADTEVTPLSGAEYAKKENEAQIAAKMQRILDAEAPIAYDRLVKKTLRAFNINRSSTQTLQASELAYKKVSVKNKKQDGVRFCWRPDQDPDAYRIYRSELGLSDKRKAEEVCKQEYKNAICFTLHEKGELDKDTLIRETIRVMGFSRSGSALVAAVERSLKFGRKSGEIIQDQNAAGQKIYKLPE